MLMLLDFAGSRFAWVDSGFTPSASHRSYAVGTQNG